MRCARLDDFHGARDYERKREALGLLLTAPVLMSNGLEALRAIPHELTMMMHSAFKTLSQWDALADEEREDAARTLARGGFEYAGLERHEQGGVARSVAMFTWSDGARFAFVPGGSVELGFDPNAAPTLDDLGREDWAAAMTELGFPEFEKHFAQVLLPRRRVDVAPLLVEVREREVGDVIEDYDHEALLASLTNDGFRLLTSDEWEHACRGGTRTIWRWGDSFPADELPYGNVRFPELLTLNAFGLAIAQDPYRWEYVMEPGRMRGGDGGDAICGGYGTVASWVALASAYVWPMFDDDSYLDEGFVRRAFPLT